MVVYIRKRLNIFVYTKRSGSRGGRGGCMVSRMEVNQRRPTGSREINVQCRPINKLLVSTCYVKCLALVFVVSTDFE